jgi:hypothetical protein
MAMHANAQHIRVDLRGPGRSAWAWRSSSPRQAPAGRALIADVAIQGTAWSPPRSSMGILARAPAPVQRRNGGRGRQPHGQQARRYLGDARDTADGKVVVTFHVVEPPNEIQEIEFSGPTPEERRAAHPDRAAGRALNRWPTSSPARPSRAATTNCRPWASCELLEGGQMGDRRVVFQITEGGKVKVTASSSWQLWVTGARLATQINSSKQIFGIFGGDYNPVMADFDSLKLEVPQVVRPPRRQEPARAATAPTCATSRLSSTFRRAFATRSAASTSKGRRSSRATSSRPW